MSEETEKTEHEKANEITDQALKAKLEYVEMKVDMGTTVIINDGHGVESCFIVHTCKNERISGHLLKQGLSAVVWLEEIPHYNLIRGQEGVAYWKKEP